MRNRPQRQRSAFSVLRAVSQRTERDSGEERLHSIGKKWFIV